MKTAGTIKNNRMGAKKDALNRKKPWEVILYNFPIWFFIVIIVLPFFVVVSASLSDAMTIAREGVSLIPKGINLSAYRILFKYPTEILTAYFISIVVTVAGTAGSLVLSIMLAFPLSRKHFNGRRGVSFLLLFFMMFQAGLVPSYIFYRNYLNIYNTLFVLILPQMLPLGHVFTMRLFFETVPTSLYESAKVDGASEFRIMFQIATPLILPGLSTIAFYVVLMYWNDAYTALYYTESASLIPISLYVTRISNYIIFLKQMQAMGGFAGVDISGMPIPEETIMFSIAIVAAVPMLIVFLFFQRLFIGGLTAGSVKE